MKTVALLMTSLCLVGCTQVQSPRLGESSDYGAKMSYFRDARTGLCFAYLTSMTYAGNGVASITNVPCEKVESVIGK